LEFNNKTNGPGCSYYSTTAFRNKNATTENCFGYSATFGGNKYNVYITAAGRKNGQAFFKC